MDIKNLKFNMKDKKSIIFFVNKTELFLINGKKLTLDENNEEIKDIKELISYGNGIFILESKDNSLDCELFTKEQLKNSFETQIKELQKKAELMKEVVENLKLKGE